MIKYWMKQLWIWLRWPFLSAEERRLFYRFSIDDVHDVGFYLKYYDNDNRKFLPRDISLGGLSFWLDSDEQKDYFKTNQRMDIIVKYRESKIKIRVRIAFCIKDFAGGEIIGNKKNFKKFMSEKMGEVLVKRASEK